MSDRWATACINTTINAKVTGRGPLSDAASLPGWAIGKRIWHWALAIAVSTAFFAPKPGTDNDGLLHISAGLTALALVVLRLAQRLTADLRPRLRDSLKPTPTSRVGRGLGFLLLALVPLAAGFAMAGLKAGATSPFLDAHRATGLALMLLAMVHATLVPAAAAWSGVDLVGLTISRRGPWHEGRLRGAIGLALGVAAAGAVLAYAWGPLDVPGLARSLG